MRLLFVIPLCALASSQATAQNNASRILMALGEDARNMVVTRLVRDSSETCDRVIRTLFKGTELRLDEWEALCRDGNSYSFIIPPELSAGIELDRYGGLNGDFVPVCGGCHAALRPTAWTSASRSSMTR